MRLLLHNRKTRQFLRTARDDWTDDPLLTREFETGRDAAKLAQEQRFQHVEILLIFENARSMSLPLRAPG